MIKKEIINEIFSEPIYSGQFSNLGDFPYQENPLEIKKEFYKSGLYLLKDMIKAHRYHSYWRLELLNTNIKVEKLKKFIEDIYIWNTTRLANNDWEKPVFHIDTYQELVQLVDFILESIPKPFQCRLMGEEV